MQRRDFLKTAAAAPLAADAATSKPNFLFLIADDLTHRGIRAAGNGEVETPISTASCATAAASPTASTRAPGCPPCAWPAAACSIAG